MKDDEKPGDYLQTIIDSKYRDGTHLDDEAVVGMLVAALFGGQHTSNITSTWLLMMIHSADAKAPTTDPVTGETKAPLLERLLDEQRKNVDASLIP